MKRCLVTGGTGFVGANVVRRLLRDGHRVDLLVRPGHARWRLAGIDRDVCLHEMIPGDDAALKKTVETARPDWIFNLAAHGAYSWQNDACSIVETNLTGTLRLLETAATMGFEAFVQAGSSSEYGFKDHAPDEDEPADPNSVYAVTKNAASQYCRWMGKGRGLPVSVLRLYSVYGPWEDPARLIPSLILQGREGRFPPLVNPAIARDFVHVDDVTDAFVLAAGQAAKNPGEIFNVGTGTQTTLEQAVEVARSHFRIAEAPGWGSMPDRAWDTAVWVAKADKIKAVFGWEAKTGFAGGFEQSAAWFESHLSILPQLAGERA